MPGSQADTSTDHFEAPSVGVSQKPSVGSMFTPVSLTYGGGLGMPVRGSGSTKYSAPPTLLFPVGEASIVALTSTGPPPWITELGVTPPEEAKGPRVSVGVRWM